MVSNGQELDRDRLERLDGRLGLLLVSFSSVVPEVYAGVHRLLDRERVMRNIRLAREVLRHTEFGISLSPMPAALATLDETVAWLRGAGVELLTMSPTLYNRAGSDEGLDLAPEALRRLMRRHGLRSQELDFISGPRDFLGQWFNNRHRCVPRNTDLLIAATGDYLYCFNDIAHSHCLGSVEQFGVREALRRRQATPACEALCGGCNLQGRYSGRELVQVALKYAGHRLRSRLAGA
jgi:hypothetical protein